jgi:bifunctional non-homologous end joining protein LigD
MKDSERIQIRSRNNKDLTRMYPTVTAAGQRLMAKQAVIDGEIIAADKEGHHSFQPLQHRGSHTTHQIAFYAFDLLHLDGVDLTQEPIEERRSRLRERLAADPIIRYLEDLPGTAADILPAVRAAGFEGIVAKRKGSYYEPGERSNDWQKLKLENQQEFVIGGYRRDGDDSLDALLVGYCENKELQFAGKVRAGMVPFVKRKLVADLKPLRTDHCPFRNLPDAKSSRWGGGLTAAQMREFAWTQPQLVAQIRFVEWTAERRLRHAAFLGLRSDKTPDTVHREL